MNAFVIVEPWIYLENEVFLRLPCHMYITYLYMKNYNTINTVIWKRGSQNAKRKKQTVQCVLVIVPVDHVRTVKKLPHLIVKRFPSREEGGRGVRRLWLASSWKALRKGHYLRQADVVVWNDSLGRNVHYSVWQCDRGFFFTVISLLPSLSKVSTPYKQRRPLYCRVHRLQCH